MKNTGYPFDGPLVTDGVIHRYSSDGNKDEPDEWYVAWEGISKNGYTYLNCAFGTWQGGFTKEIYNSFSNDKSIPTAERKKSAEAWEKQKIELENLLKQEEEQRKRWAVEAWEKAKIIPDKSEHTIYLERKNCRRDGIKYGYAKFGKDLSPTIAIDLRNVDGELQAIQRIRADGKKKISGPKSGHFHLRGEIKENTHIYIGEGLATVDSGVQGAKALGIDCAGVVAVDCGNLMNVTANIRVKYPNHTITILYDDDKETTTTECTNPGKTKAEKAANRYGCNLVGPVFPQGEDHDPLTCELLTDFNDLHIQFGLEEVSKQLKGALEATKTKQEASTMPIDDNEEEEGESEDKAKAKASARRKALIHGLTLQKIVRSICKQYPAMSKEANDIAEQALLWAEKYQPGCIVNCNGIPKTITNMKSLDARFAQLEAPAQPCVTINRLDAQPISTYDFNKRLSGEVIVCDVNEKGQPKYISASVFWTGNTYKFIYKNIVFTNKNVGDDTYNLFTGFGITPKEGNCQKILNHVSEVICAGNQINKTALLKLLAWQIQNIGRPSRIILALKSKAHQAGKGTLLADILAPIYGNSGFMTSELSQILTRFNDTIRGKAYIYLDEALFSGDRKAADGIKSLATTTQIGIESKGIPTVKLPIAVNIFLTTNHDDAAYIEEADARYWILEVSPHCVGNTTYFKELYDEIEGRGREAFMHYLLSLDVKDFVPWRDVPKDNEFKDEMIRNSINPYDARKWLEACCHAEMILGLKPLDERLRSPWELWEQGQEYENGLLSSAYAEWQKTIRSPVAPRPTSHKFFGMLLNDAGFTVRNNKGKKRTLPDPNVCLKIVAAMIGKVGK